MKKLGVIMVVLNLMFSSLYAFPKGCVAVKENGAGEGFSRVGFRWLGLFYCLEMDDKEAVKEKLYRLAAHSECYNYIQIGDSQAAFEELKTYINKKKEWFKEYPKQSFEFFRGCMIIYDNPDYKEEIEKIVKKYCKDEDCEW